MQTYFFELFISYFTTFSYLSPFCFFICFLSVFFTDQPTWISFTINTEKSDNVFVHEMSIVTMKCQSDGRPAPRMTITKVRDQSILYSRPIGSIIKEDQKGEITYITAAQCSDADMYMCTAANILGMKNQSVSLSVRCE